MLDASVSDGKKGGKRLADTINARRSKSSDKDFNAGEKRAIFDILLFSGRFVGTYYLNGCM
jgi:hypothetical protein